MPDQIIGYIIELYRLWAGDQMIHLMEFQNMRPTFLYIEVKIGIFAHTNKKPKWLKPVFENVMPIDYVNGVT